jgi:STE24 endopeptidase
MLLVSWLTAPWRVMASLLTGLAGRLAGHQPRPGLAVVVLAGLAVAVTRAVRQGQWMVGGVLAFVGLAVVVCPLADAAISRRAEMAADLFAAEHGLASELAAALHALNDGHRAACGSAATTDTAPSATKSARPSPETPPTDAPGGR